MFPSGVDLTVGDGRMSDDLRALRPIRTIMFDSTTSSQAALHMPVSCPFADTSDRPHISGVRSHDHMDRHLDNSPRDVDRRTARTVDRPGCSNTGRRALDYRASGGVDTRNWHSSHIRSVVTRSNSCATFCDIWQVGSQVDVTHTRDDTIEARRIRNAGRDGGTTPSA